VPIDVSPRVQRWAVGISLVLYQLTFFAVFLPFVATKLPATEGLSGAVGQRSRPGF
jgi:hypothetical protein